MAQRQQGNDGRWLVMLVTCLMLTACGGGSGSGPTPPIANIADEPTLDEGGDGDDGSSGADETSWDPDVFEAADTFAAMCASPRQSGFPDVEGTVTDENNWLRSMGNDTYLWYDEINDVDPGTVDDPLDYFDLMKTFVLTPAGNNKDRFHFTFDTEAWNQLSGSGVSAGYGIKISLVSSTPPRKAIVAYTEPDTPATSADVNLARGAEILEVDGVDVVNASGSANIDVLNAGLFPSELNVTHEFLVRDLNASDTRLVTMTSREIMSVPVQNVTTIETGSGTVGYIVFNDHIATSEQLLIDAVNELKEAAVSDLVLDLRYNGGGFLDIANEAAYMIAGSASEGLVFDELQFNDKHQNFDPVTGRLLTPTLFRTTARGFSATTDITLPTLDLPRVFVLTSGGTCSASEAIINGLSGIDIEVIQIGSNTCGKPYGFYALDNCGTSYFTIQFRSVNAKGFGDYTDGFSPSSDVADPSGTALPGCNVADDLSHALGDPEEAKLATALAFRENGVCPEPVASARRLSDIGDSEGRVVKHEWLRNMTITP